MKHFHEVGEMTHYQRKIGALTINLVVNGDGSADVIIQDEKQRTIECLEYSENERDEAHSQYFLLVRVLENVELKRLK